MVVAVALAAVLAAGCGTPLYTWDVHIGSARTTPSLDVAALTSEPISTFGLVAPSSLQGLGPGLSDALHAALADASPPIRGMRAAETLNRINERGLAGEYGELQAGFSRSGILDRERLQRVAPALYSRYVLQPGLAAFDQSVGDRFELAGFKLIKIRLTTLRLWLQLWDIQTGQMLSESWGEVTVATQLLVPAAAVSLDDIARRLWSRLIQDGLLEGKTRWRLFSH